MQSGSKEVRARIEDGCLVIKQNTQWDRWKDNLYCPLYSAGKKIKIDMTFLDFLKLLGNITCENFIGGLETVTRASIKSRLREYLVSKYSFSIGAEYKHHLKDDAAVSNELREVFKYNKFPLPGRAKIIKLDKRNWKIECGTKKYFVEDSGTDLKVFSEELEAQLELFENIRIPDKIKQVNNMLKDLNINNRVFIKKVGENYKLQIFSIIPPVVDDGIKPILFLHDDRLKQILAIIQLEEKLKQVDIVCLQPLLKELDPKEKEGKFFRKTGPKWIDFEKGYVVERDEVNKIIEDMEENPIQLLIGYPASGKSTIARNVGYKLTKKGWSVFIISASYFREEWLKEITWLKEIKNEIDFIGKNFHKSLIIIEDLHISTYNWWSLLQSLDIEKLGINFLITTNESYERNTMKVSEHFFENLRKIHLTEESFSNAADSIVSRYVRMILVERHPWFFTVFGEDDEDVSEDEICEFEINFGRKLKEIVKGNFVLLGYLLGRWSPASSSKYESIFKCIREDLIELQKEFNVLYSMEDSVYVILLIAPFSEREINVPKIFLKNLCKKIDIDYSVIRKLIERGEIEIRDDEFLSIPYPIIAELYLESFYFIDEEDEGINYLDYLLDKLNSTGLNFKKNSFVLDLFKMFLQSKPRNYGKIISKICKYESTGFYKTDEILPHMERFKRRINVPLRSLLMDKNTLKCLTECINDYGDIENVVDLLFGLCRASAVPSEEYIKKYIKKEDFLSKKDIETYLDKIDPIFIASTINQEQSGYSIARYLVGVECAGDEKFKQILLENLDMDGLKLKLTNGEDFSMMYIFHIINAIIGMDESLLPEFKDVISITINNQKNLKSFLTLLDYWKTAIPHIYDTIIDTIKSSNIFKIMEKSTPFAIMSFFSEIKHVVLKRKEDEKKLVEILSNKIDEEVDPLIPFKYLAEIAIIGEKGKKIVSKIIKRIYKYQFRSNFKEFDGEEVAWLMAQYMIYHYQCTDGFIAIMDELNLWELLSRKKFKDIKKIIEMHG